MCFAGVTAARTGDRTAPAFFLNLLRPVEAASVLGVVMLFAAALVDSSLELVGFGVTALETALVPFFLNIVREMPEAPGVAPRGMASGATGLPRGFAEVKGVPFGLAFPAYPVGRYDGGTCGVTEGFQPEL